MDEALDRAIAVLRSDITPNTAEAREILAATEDAIRTTVTLSKVGGAVQALADRAGLVAEEVVKVFSIGGAGEGQAIFRSVGRLTNAFEFLVDSSKTLTGSQLEFNEANKSALVALRLINNLDKELLEGRISSEGITKSLLAIFKEIDKSEKQRLASTLKTNAAAFNGLKITAEQLRIRGEEQVAIENITKLIRDTFSAQISAAGKLTGVTALDGKIATTTLEVRKNQLDVLQLKLPFLSTRGEQIL